MSSSTTNIDESGILKNTPSKVNGTVILHIYSISDRINRFSLMLGLGLYHTAVEIYGQEHSFVGHPFHFTGIVSTVPKTAAYIYQEGLEIGRTSMDERAVGNQLKELGKIFTGNSYHLLNKNCNHFSNEFLYRLCRAKIPTYINRAANSACCLPFLDTMFSVKSDSERFFVEVLYLTFHGDLTSVITLLHAEPETSQTRYVSYIEAAMDDHSIPQCFPFHPIIKSSNPFALSSSVIELIEKNLCTNFIFTQSKVVYDQASNIFEHLKIKEMETRTDFDQFPRLTCPEAHLDPDARPFADYTTDIHRYLDLVHQRLIDLILETIPIDTESKTNEF